MSGTSINKKLQKAYQKIGKKLGFTFKAYRTLDLITPVQNKNLIGELELSFSIDDNFKKPQGEQFKMYNVFLDTTNYELGDIFVSDEAGKTFVLSSKEPIVTPQAIEAPHRVTITRVAYPTSGTFEPTNVEVAKDIPAAIFQTGAAGVSSTVSQVKNQSGANQYSIWIWLPQNNIKVDDVITDQFGHSSRVTSVEYSAVGYKILTKDAEVK